jgi:CPA1 family monovalent cation:H+ antiporter
MEHLLRTSDAIIDATRADGRLGYLRAAKRRLRPGTGLRLAAWLHRRLRIDWPLTGLIAQQFEMVLVMRLVFLAQLRFMRERMTPVLGARVTEVLGEIVERRRGLLDDAMAALGVLHPAHGEALQSKMLRQIGLRFEMDTYTTLRAEALLSDELFAEIQRDVEARRDAIPPPVVLDLRTAMRSRLREFAPFSRIAEKELDSIARRTAMRMALPGERILNRRQSVGCVYLVSSGEVEIEHLGTRRRLGRGAQFGGDGSLGEAQTLGAVTAIRFCLLLMVRAQDFPAMPALVAAGAPGRHE